MSRASASRRTPSRAITDCAGTTSSWSAGPTSTARPSWSRPTRPASRRVRLPTVSTRSSARTSARSGSRTTSSRGRRRGTTIASRRISSGRCTRRASCSSARRSARSPPRPDTRCPIGTSRARARSAAFDDARGDQCDNCGNQLDPIDLIDPRSKIDGTPPVFRTTKHLFLDLPAFKEQLTEWIEREGRLAAERPPLLAQLREGAQAASDHARPRLGCSDSGRGLRGPRRQADLRVVRRGHRLPLRVDRVGRATVGLPTRGASGGRTPTPSTRTSWGRTTSSSTRVIWPSMLLGYGSGGDVRRGTRRPEAPGQRRLERVPDDGGEEVQRESRRADPRPRLPRAATTPTRFATSSRSQARRRRTRTSRGPSSFGGTTTSSSRRGAISSIGRSRARTRTSARFRRRRRSRRTTRPCSVRSRADSTRSAR